MKKAIGLVKKNKIFFIRESERPGDKFYCRVKPRTPKGNEKQFELAGNSSYRGKFQWNFDQGKGNLVLVSGEFELSDFELSRFYCIYPSLNVKMY